jgi:hypothetical protein
VLLFYLPLVGALIKDLRLCGLVIFFLCQSSKKKEAKKKKLFNAA